MIKPALPPAELLTLTVTRTERSARVAAAGEIDICSAPRLSAALHEAVSGGSVDLTVDLRNVTFLSSSGVHALARAHRRITTVGGRVVLLQTGRAVLRPLQISGLWRLLGQAGDAPAATDVPA